MGGWVLMLIAGVIALAGGIFALFNPLAATITAVLLTAWLFIIVGVIEIVSVFSATGWGGRIWALLLGALTIALGVWMLSNPLPSVLALTWLIGILFLGHVDKWRSQRRMDVMSMKPRKLSAVLS